MKSSQRKIRIGDVVNTSDGSKTVAAVDGYGDILVNRLYMDEDKLPGKRYTTSYLEGCVGLVTRIDAI